MRIARSFRKMCRSSSFQRVYFTLFLWSLQLQLRTISGNDNVCYRPVFLNTSWTDSRPSITFNMTFTQDGFLISETIVNREVASPISKLLLTQQEGNGRSTTLYNASSKMCDFQQLLNKVPILQSIAQNALRQGNYSFARPLLEGVYVVNLRLYQKSPFLAVLFRPKIVYTLLGGLFEGVNRTERPLSTYYIVMKISKKAYVSRKEAVEE